MAEEKTHEQEAAEEQIKKDLEEKIRALRPTIEFKMDGHEIAVAVKEIFGDAAKVPGKKVKSFFRHFTETVKGAAKGAKDGFKSANETK